MRGATRSRGRAGVCQPVSIHAPHAGRDEVATWTSIIPASFNPRAPCGARPIAVFSMLANNGFNPRAPCGARLQRYGRKSRTTLFQSTRPMRGATDIAALLRQPRGVSIHAPHAGRDASGDQSTRTTLVSIHAPHAGRDSAAPPCGHSPPSFNPRAPCGARLLFMIQQLTVISFNPRAPCGARHPQRILSLLALCFNPRAPCGARPSLTPAVCMFSSFNPRAPCGARPRSARGIGVMILFQSTRPMRGATWRSF